MKQLALLVFIAVGLNAQPLPWPSNSVPDLIMFMHTNRALIPSQLTPVSTNVADLTTFTGAISNIIFQLNTSVSSLSNYARGISNNSYTASNNLTTASNTLSTTMGSLATVSNSTVGVTSYSAALSNNSIVYAFGVSNNAVGYSIGVSNNAITYSLGVSNNDFNTVTAFNSFSNAAKTSITMSNLNLIGVGTANFPTSSIPAGASGVTNAAIVIYRGIARVVATNRAAGGWMTYTNWGNGQAGWAPLVP